MAEEEIGKLAPAGCSLTHLFQYEDTDNNDVIDLNEFYVAFNELYSKWEQLVYLLVLCIIIIIIMRRKAKKLMEINPWTLDEIIYQ